MGRKFDAQQLKDKLNAKYNIGGQVVSNAELLKRDQAVIDAYRQDLEGRMKKTADAIVRDYFNRIGAEFNTGDDDADTHQAISYLLAVSVRVLVERFGWKPVRYNCRPTKLQRFAEYVLEEINTIRADNTLDIRDYADEVERMYGVRFRMTETEDDEIQTTHSKE